MHRSRARLAHEVADYLSNERRCCFSPSALPAARKTVRIPALLLVAGVGRKLALRPSWRLPAVAGARALPQAAAALPALQRAVSAGLAGKHP